MRQAFIRFLIALALAFGAGYSVSAQADATEAGYARRAPLADKSLLLAAARAGQRVVAVGEYGHVLLSDDEGASWRQARSVPTRTTLTAVTFVDAEHGWAVGHGGQILASADGGETWRVQFGAIDGPDSLFSVWFRDVRHGIAVGPYGYALATQDGGKTWERFYVAEGEDGERHLNGIFADAGGRLFLAAEFGAVFVSDDQGQHWRLIEVPYEGSLWGGMARADGSVLIWGMAGHALRSTDRGETWTELATGTDQSLTGGAELPGGEVVLVGLGGAVSFGSPDLAFKAITRADRQMLTGVLPVRGGLLLCSQNGVSVFAGGAGAGSGGR